MDVVVAFTEGGSRAMNSSEEETIGAQLVDRHGREEKTSHQSSNKSNLPRGEWLLVVDVYKSQQDWRITYMPDPGQVLVRKHKNHQGHRHCIIVAQELHHFPCLGLVIARSGGGFSLESKGRRSTVNVEEFATEKNFHLVADGTRNTGHQGSCWEYFPLRLRITISWRRAPRCI